MPTIVTDPSDFPSAFERSLNNGDVEAIVALYDEEAVIRLGAADIRAGTDAVRAEMGQLIGGKARLANTLRHTLRCGDTALIIVDYVLDLTIPDGRSVSMTGTATNVIRYDERMGWRMIIANPPGLS